MKLLKQLDKLVLKSFLGPYLVSFLVAEFVLVLQFLWKYIDDFVGRGISLWVIFKMIFYYGLTIIPLAVPISILISSVMVYGAMSEKYELTAFKSAGVSLGRIMRPGIFIAIATAIFSIFSSNYLKPRANYFFFQTFENVRRAKPTLTIDEGIFNHDFKGFALRVGKKEANGRDIKDILIYDQTDRKLLNLTTAQSGEMYISPDGLNFTMELNNGVQYSELNRKDNKGRRDADQVVTIEFEKWIKHFDMSAFEFSFSEGNMGRRKHDLYNSFQMVAAIDSIDLKKKEIIAESKNNYSFLKPEIIEPDLPEAIDSIIDEYQPEKKPGQQYKDTVINGESVINLSDIPFTKPKKPKVQKVPVNKKSQEYYLQRTLMRYDSVQLSSVSTFSETIKKDLYKGIVFRAKSNAQTIREKYRTLKSSLLSQTRSSNKFKLRLHQQFCWAVICIIFMFIGAPLGSIVRKGGFGYPLLIAIAFFIIFIFTSILGEKLMASGVLHPILGAWLPLVFLVPFAVYFTTKAINDSRFEFNFNIGSWFK